MGSRGWTTTAGVHLLAACGSGNGGDIQGPPNNTPPTANFGVNCTGLDCSFSDSSTDAEGSLEVWQWDFGDGTTATDQNPVHSYTTAASYSTPNGLSMSRTRSAPPSHRTSPT